MSQVPTARGPVAAWCWATEHGVTEEQVATMLTANPRRFFDKTG
jgi:hypothetical protein